MTTNAKRKQPQAEPQRQLSLLPVGDSEQTTAQRLHRRAMEIQRQKAGRSR